jgi:hypothetical protein
MAKGVLYANPERKDDGNDHGCNSGDQEAIFNRGSSSIISSSAGTVAQMSTISESDGNPRDGVTHS